MTLATVILCAVAVASALFYGEVCRRHILVYKAELSTLQDDIDRLRLYIACLKMEIYATRHECGLKPLPSWTKSTEDSK